jgi:hypothetical protein
MIHAETPSDGIRGTLSMEDRGVVFSPKGPGGEMVFPLPAIGRAKRTVGSPVLQLRIRLPDQPKLVGFYFTRPPSLELQQGHFLSRTKARRDAAVTLVTSNLNKKDEVARWVEVIREAKKRRSG